MNYPALLVQDNSFLDGTKSAIEMEAAFSENRDALEMHRAMTEQAAS